MYLLLSCPLAVHFDFCTPIDKYNYTVAENDTTLEVCVKLVSTNSSNNTIMSPVLILLTTSFSSPPSCHGNG